MQICRYLAIFADKFKMMIETRTAILTYADSRESFRFADLWCHLNSIISITKVTLAWHLKQLVQSNFLVKLGRGVYTSRQSKVQPYSPYLRENGIKFGKRLSKAFPFIKYSIFDGEVLADFQHHLSINKVIYIEVEREVMESVFHWLKGEGLTAYLNPDKRFIYDNMDLSKEAFIVKPLISESPLTAFRGIYTPKIEKILVDILCDDHFDYLHGSEWQYIFNHIIETYAVSRSTLIRYASRRNAKEKVIKSFELMNNI